MAVATSKQLYLMHPELKNVAVVLCGGHSTLIYTYFSFCLKLYIIYTTKLLIIFIEPYVELRQRGLGEPALVPQEADSLGDLLAFATQEGRGAGQMSEKAWRPRG